MGLKQVDTPGKTLKLREHREVIEQVKMALSTARDLSLRDDKAVT